MKMTLLQLTQRVLSSFNGEEVNSITDTAESVTVADIIKECYFDIISNADYPELKTIFELTSSGDSTKPTMMTIPNSVVGVEWVKYDVQRLGDGFVRMQEMKVVPLRDFIYLVDNYNTTDTSIGSMQLVTSTGDTVSFNYRNDVPPSLYTSFDDHTIIFDAYDSQVDSTLQKSKTKCFGLTEPTWSSVDTFTPILDSQQFNILIKEAKAMAWMELRQTENASAEKAARRGRILANTKKSRADYDEMAYYREWYPNYGRKAT